MDKLRFQNVLRRALMVPIAIAGFLAVALLGEVQYLVNRAHWVEHTDRVIQVAQSLYRAKVDQETGLRAYLLTNDPRFLQPYRDGRDQAHRLELQLAQLISDDPAQQERNEKAFQAYSEWSAFAEEAIALSNAGHDVGDPAFQLRGKELMDKVRRARTDFITQEEQLRDQRLASSRRTLWLVNTSIVAFCVLLGAISAGFGRKQLVNLSAAFSEVLDTAEASAAELRAQREWLHTTLSSIGDAVIATDADGAITFMNAAAETLTGWSLAEAKTKPLADVFHIVNQQTRELVENPIDKVRRLNQVVGLANHTLLISKSGTEFAIDDSGAPIRDANGDIAGIVLVFRDVTQQRRLEVALQSNERLAVAGRLSASIAHEIHNPLDTVGNLLFLVAQQLENRPELQPMIATAQAELHRVTQVSKNMLSLHRESRAPSPVNLNELLDGVVALIDETLAKGRRKIRIEHGFDGDIEGFPGELRQVFTNLIKNAVEATAEGGSIHIFSVPMQHNGRPGVLIHVADNGVGVPEEMKSRLFSPFAGTKQESGSGLGLWVSRSILEKHGGAIRVSSSTDPLSPGTTVSVFLPLRAAAQAADDDSASAAHPTAA